jgi:hypothetical protein
MSEPVTRPPWLLYHGTSTRRLQQIRQENVLRVSATGEPKVALTPARSVAAFWASSAVSGDILDRTGRETRPVILVIDGEALGWLGYSIQGYSDAVWGVGECDWENEFACWDDIVPLHEVLVRIKKVPIAVHKIWVEIKREQPFWPRRPWIGERVGARKRRSFNALCDAVLKTGAGRGPTDENAEWDRLCAILEERVRLRTK